MAIITLNVGVDSYLSVSDANSVWKGKYFNLPGISQWDALNESFNSEQSQIILRASKDIEYFLRSYVIPFLIPDHSIIFQPEGFITDYMKEATFVHSLHLLLYSSLISPNRFKTRKSIGPLLSSFDSKELQTEVVSLSPLSYKLLDMYLRELRDAIQFGTSPVQYSIKDLPNLPSLTDNGRNKGGLSPSVYNLRIART